MSNKENKKFNTKIHPAFIILGVFIAIAIPSVWWAISTMISPVDVPLTVGTILQSYLLAGTIILIAQSGIEFYQNRSQ